MAKQIIVLEKQGANQFRVVFWASVPAARQAFYLDANKTSQWKDASSIEIAAIQAGQVTESVETISVPPNATLAQMQQILIDRFNAFQSDVTNTNPWNRYGTFWDGTSWTAGGVS